MVALGATEEALRTPAGAQVALPGGQSESQRHVGLPCAAVSHGDDVLPAINVLAPGELEHQLFVHRRDRQEVEGVEALDRREARSPDPPLHHPVMTVYEFEFSKPQKVVGMVHSLRGALLGHPVVLPQERRQSELLQMVLKQYGRSVAHDAALPDSRVM